MCRFMMYQGPPILIDQLLMHTSNSLIEQSKSAKKRRDPVNGDGFGIGWYPTHSDPEPGTFVSVDPAWSSRNLQQISAKVITQHFFAHIRDASEGMQVSQANCHPFQWGRFLWMHNGILAEFTQFKRSLINLLSDRAYHHIKGNTDSEHAFALFLDQIQFNEEATPEQMKQAMLKTLSIIKSLQQAAEVQSVAHINFVVSNGNTSLTTRYASHLEAQPPSLFYTQGKLICHQNKWRVKPSTQENDAVIIASEPLTETKEDWIKVDRHQLLLMHQNELFLEPIE